VVAIAVVIGIALRFWVDSPLWLDEALTVNIAALGVGEIPDALARDGLPPLYYVLLHAWMSAVGNGDGAARALAGVISVLTLPVMYLAGRRLGGHRVGVLAVGLLALNPYAIRYATEARMYSLVMLLVLLGYLAVMRATEEDSSWALLGVAAVTAALAYTHYWALWLLGAVGVLMVVDAWRASSADVRRRARRVLGAMAVGALAFLPWLPTFLDQAAHTATPWASASRPTQVAAYTLEDFAGSEVAEAMLGAFVLGVLFLLGLFGRALGDRTIEIDLRTVPETRPVAGVAVLGLGIGSAAALVTQSAFAPRYAAIVFPLFLLVAAAGVSRFAHRWAATAVLVGVLALGLAVTVHNARTPRTQAGEIAAAILAGDPDGRALGTPVVVYCPDQLGPAVSRLLPDTGFDQVIFPELELDTVEVPERVDWYDYAERQRAILPDDVAAAIDERAGPANAIWVVFSPAYRTVDERCVQLLDALGTRRPGRPVVVEDPERFFEHGGLQLYPPATGAGQ
jgi:hypothetical protein